jgi:predicted flap endonuclease-1-like 5' DNA nuclease
MAKLASIEVIGQKYGEKLEKAGVTTIEALLKIGATTAGRKEIASKTALNENQILDWVNRADLFRVKGIGSQYADLLENAGVDSLPELAQRNPENLLMQLQEVNDAKHLVRSMPYLKQVRKWVGQAKNLPKIVNH